MSNSDGSMRIGLFQEVDYDVAGRWDFETSDLHFAELVTPAIHLEGAGSKAIAHNVIPSSAIARPGTGLVGGWRGRMIGRHLFVAPSDASRILDRDVNLEMIANRGFRREGAVEGAPDVVSCLLRLIADDLRAGSPSGPEFFEHLVAALVNHAVRQPTTHRGARPGRSRTDRGIERSVEAIRSGLGQPLPLVELAREAGVSVSYYCQKFRALTGETPHRFILRQRIELATRLLRDKDRSIVDVVLEAGFGDQSHFTTMFRRYTGMTPARFRAFSTS